MMIVVSPSSSTAANSKDSKIYDVIIVGGGIAGLTAAFYLTEYDFLVLEKERQAGGRAASGHYKGVSYAKGAEYLGLPEFPLSEIITSLNLPLRHIPAPAGILYHRKKAYTGYSDRARLLIEESSFGEYNRFAEKILSVYDTYDEIPEIDLSGELKSLDTLTARQWFENNHFSSIYIDIFNVAFRGLFGANSDEISALSAIPELAFEFEGFEPIEDEDDLAEELSSDDSTGMYSFDNGIAQIPLAIAAHIGDRLKTDIKVTEVKRVGELFEIHCVLTDKSLIMYRSEAVILATPSAITVDIAGKVLGDEQLQLLSSVSYAPYTTIALFSSKPIFSKAFAMTVPDDLIFTDIYDATWIARHYNGALSSQPVSIALAYLAPVSFKNDTLQSMPDNELVNTVLTQLDTILPDSSELIEDFAVTRFHYGLPVMTPGSYQRMSRLQALSDEAEDGLFLAGDYLVYPTFEAASFSGWLAASKAIDWMED